MINATGSYIPHTKPIQRSDLTLINKLKRFDNSNMLKNTAKIFSILSKYKDTEYIIDVPQYAAPAIVAYFTQHDIHVLFKKRVNGKNVLIRY